MKRFKLLLICFPVLLLALIPLVGCGIPQSDYDALLSEKTNLESEKQTLQNDYDTLATAHESLQAEKSTLEAEKQALKEDYDTLNNENDTLESDLGTLQGEKQSLQDNYTAVNSELTEIQKVYPPRNFSSLRELTDWLLTNDVSEKPDTIYAEDTLARAYEIQEDALIDGYIISVDYDLWDDGTATIVCAAYINGTIFYWSPDDDITYEETYFLTIAW